MAFTQEQLDLLEEAIAQGAREVEYSDKRVVYNSFKEMIQARDLMKRELGLSCGSGRKYADFRSGLNNSDC